MEDKIRRSLSPWPTVLVWLALMLFFVAERMVADESLRIVFGVLAAASFVVGVLWRGLALRGVEGDARRMSLASLALYGVIGLVAVCHFLRLSMAEGAPPDARGPVVLQIASVILAAIGVGPLLALELAARQMRPAAFVEWRRARQAIGTGLSIVVGIAALFLLNYAAHQRMERKDFSFGAPSSPSPATVSLVQASPEPIEVYLFLERGNRLQAEVQDYFDGLLEAGASFEQLDQAINPELAKELKVTGNGYVGLKSGERAGKWYLGTELDNSRTRLKRMDKELRGELAKLAIEKRKVYFTSGHGERQDAKASKGEAPGGKQLRDVVRGFNGTVRSLGLAEGLGHAVPDDADLVVVFGPTSSFMPAEVAALTRYLEGGGDVLVLVDPKVDHGLAPLLAALGLEVGAHEVCNDSVFLQQSYSKADHAFLVTNSFTSHKSVRSLSRVRGRAALALKSAGALRKPKPDSKGKVTFVVRALAKSYEDLNGDRTFNPDTEQHAVPDLVAVVEVPAQGGDEGRSAVIADSDLFDDLLLGNQANLVLAYDLVTWLLGDDALSGEVASDEDVPIRHTREGDKLWFYGTTFAAPALVLGLGLTLVSLKRRRRQP